MKTWFQSNLDETLHQQDFDNTDLNGEDGNGVEGLYGDYDFNLQDYLL